jgi:hypothetical protein
VGRVIGPKVSAARWLLLCTLAFGVVGMHHLASICHGDDHAEVTLVAMPSPTTTIAEPVTGLGGNPDLLGRTSTVTGPRPRSAL